MYWVTPMLNIPLALARDCQVSCVDKPYMIEDVQK